MATETSVQDVVHSLEHGFLGSIIRWALILTVVVAVSLIYLFRDFRGIGTMEGMDQAQIARELARGNGFTTKVIRPLELWKLEKETGLPDVSGRMPELYHAPLNPFVNSLSLSLFKSSWAQAPKDRAKGFVFTQDRVIAATSMVFLLLSTILVYLLAKQLFDGLVAGMTAAVVLLTDMVWQFTLTGLPQMLMVFLFTAGSYAIFRAIRASVGIGRPAIWLAVAGILFGLLTLTHGVGAFVFLGALAFTAIYFRPRGIVMLWMLGFFLLIVLPWCYRNMSQSGNPFGLAHYAATDGVGGSEWKHMRSLHGADLPATGPQHFFSKIRGGMVQQAGGILTLMGGCIVAPVFFLALLHPYRRAETGATRWLLAAMWITGTCGFAVLGAKLESPVAPNNFQVVFLPIFVIYGVAFLVILWNRTGIEVVLLKYGFLAVILLLSAGQFILQMLPTQKARIHWPPYMPTLISHMGGEKGWMKPNELLCSDQPWAVAWYADRDCVWLPTTLKEFYELNDMRRVGKRPISGLYLTPILSDQPFVSGLVRGEYREWITLATRAQLPPGFPLTQALPFPVLDRQFPDVLFIADTRRWEEGTQEELSPAAQEEREKGMKEGVPPPPNPPGSTPAATPSAVTTPATPPPAAPASPAAATPAPVN